MTRTETYNAISLINAIGDSSVILGLDMKQIDLLNKIKLMLCMRLNEDEDEGNEDSVSVRLVRGMRLRRQAPGVY